MFLWFGVEPSHPCTRPAKKRGGKEGPAFRVSAGTKKRNLTTNGKPPKSGSTGSRTRTSGLQWIDNVARRLTKQAEVEKENIKKHLQSKQKHITCAQVPDKQVLREFKKESNQSIKAFQNPDPGSCDSTTSIALDSIVDFLTECGWYTGNVRSSSSVSEEVSDVGAPRALVHIVREE